MATSYTTNYNLKKPDPDDFVNIGDLNSNADLIDAALAAQAGGPTEQKDTPTDTDSVLLMDSTDRDTTKRLLWSKMKVALKAYLDDLFEPLLSGAVLLEDYPPNTGLFPFVSDNGETKVVEWQVMDAQFPRDI